jgi:hypothetical protein
MLGEGGHIVRFQDVPAQNRAGHVIPSKLFHSLGWRTASFQELLKRRLVEAGARSPRKHEFHGNTLLTSFEVWSERRNLPRHRVGFDSIRCQPAFERKHFRPSLPRPSGVPRRAQPSLADRASFDRPAELPDHNDASKLTFPSNPAPSAADGVAIDLVFDPLLVERSNARASPAGNKSECPQSEFLCNPRPSGASAG